MQGLEEVESLCCMDKGHGQASKDLGFLQPSEPSVHLQTDLGNQHSGRTNSVGKISATGARACRSWSNSVLVRKQKNDIVEDLRREFLNLTFNSLARVELNCEVLDDVVFFSVRIRFLLVAHFSSIRAKV